MRPFLRVLLATLAFSLAGSAAPYISQTSPQAPPSPAAAGSAAGTAPTPAAVTPMAAPGERLKQAEAAFGAAKTPVERLVALYRVSEAGELTPASVLGAALERLDRQVSQLSQPEPLLAAEIANQQAKVELRLGDGKAAAAIWSRMGTLEHWQAVGPFDNSSPSAIATVIGPEHGVHLDAHYTGKQRSVGWRPVPFAPAQGDLDLGAYLSPDQSVSAYLVSWVRSPRAQDVALRLRDDGATRVWVNGQLLFDEQAEHPSSGFDQHAVGAHLAAGWNEILAKAGDTESSDWHFSLRVTTPAGEPLVLQDTSKPPASVVPRASAPLPKIAVADLTAMAQKAAGAGAAKELDYAWVLNQKRNFNTGGNDDANAFMAAIAGLPAGSPAEVQAVLDFASHDRDISRRYRYLEQLIGQDPGNARAHLLLGSVETSRHEFWPARTQFELALGLPATPTGMLGLSAEQRAAAVARAPLAGVGMAEVYASLGIRPEVLAWAEALHAAGTASGRVSGPIGVLLEHLGLFHNALTWFQMAHAADQGNANLSLELANALRRDGDLQSSFETLRQAAALDGDAPKMMALEAEAASGLGRAPEALATIRQAVALAPDTAKYRVSQGEIERHFGHQEDAVKAWQTALALNPQDSDLRDRLRLVKGGEASQEASFERPYVQDLAQVIAAYKKEPHPELESGPLVLLSSTEVTNIFSSGNTGRYVQQIYRVDNTNGANQLSVYPVTYDPDTESVHFLVARVVHPDGSTADAPQAGDVPVTQSVGYETYYDVRNKYVVMPPMRKGDFVEIAYRVLPTTLESLYGDYFGDIDTFGGSSPTLFQQYVVISPAGKPLYFKAVRFHGQSSRTRAGGDEVYRWSARNLPAQVPEPNAPPAIEQSAYVEVSVFQTWDQFANWYRQLIRNTFVMNRQIADTVHRLVEGKTTEREKVDAIYRWVIQNTHYVALEFGIHGYRPYPVTQVFHRRYGDCKDKASLLIAMLHQAGIDADFVLVRIRELGLVDPAIPAVADFDHAIVYVPNLDLYLDGTAEFEGAGELPGGDQRAFVLRIPVARDLAADPAGGQPVPVKAVDNAPIAPVVTPEQPASANTEVRVLNGQIAPNGDLHFQMTWTLRGGDAPAIRSALEIPDRRTGAIQAMLHGKLPGISIESASVVHESDWDEPIEVTLTGTVPRFATVDGSTLLLPRQIIPRSWLPRMAALAKRTTDVLVSPPQVLEVTMHLALPPGYQVSGVPPAASLQRPFGSFQASAEVNGNTLTLKSRIETTQSLIPVAEYPAFRAFWAQVDATLGSPISSTPAEAPAQTAGGAQ